MSQIMAAVSTLFSAFFAVGDNPGYIAQVVDLVLANDYLLLGVAIMVASLSISLLSRLIHNT